MNSEKFQESTSQSTEWDNLKDEKFNDNEVNKAELIKNTFDKIRNNPKAKKIFAAIALGAAITAGVAGSTKEVKAAEPQQIISEYAEEHQLPKVETPTPPEHVDVSPTPLPFSEPLFPHQYKSDTDWRERELNQKLNAELKMKQYLQEMNEEVKAHSAQIKTDKIQEDLKTIPVAEKRNKKQEDSGAASEIEKVTTGIKSTDASELEDTVKAMSPEEERRRMTAEKPASVHDVTPEAPREKSPLEEEQNSMAAIDMESARGQSSDSHSESANYKEHADPFASGDF